MPSPALSCLAYCPEFEIWREDHDNRIWLHCTVRRWTPAIARRVRQAADSLSFALGDLWVCDNPDVPLLPKFLGLMGFAPAEFVVNCGMILTAFKRPRGA